MHIQAPYNALAGYGCRAASPTVGVGAYGFAGIDPLGAAAGAVTNALGGLFNSSDPVKDQERKARIDSEYQRAMSGDQAAVNCLAAMAQGVANNDGRICAVGSKVAATYAAAKYLEFQARHKLGQAVGVVLPVAIAESDLPTQVVGTVTRAATSPVVIGLVVLGGLWYATRRRRGARR